MIATAINNKFRKECVQHRGPRAFMLAIGIIFHEDRSLGQRHADKVTRKMADVMKQRGRYHDFVMFVLLCEMGSLQHMLADRYRFTQIFLGAAAVKNLAQEGNDCLFGKRLHHCPISTVREAFARSGGAHRTKESQSLATPPPCRFAGKPGKACFGYRRAPSRMRVRRPFLPRLPRS